MLVDTNRNADWRAVFGTHAPDSRMRDVELVARFLALNEGLASYTKPMRKFINDFMDKHKRTPGPHQHRQIFEATVRQVHEKLGPTSVPHQTRDQRRRI